MSIDRSQANRMRLIPRIEYVNFRKSYPTMGNCFTRWFSIKRFWRGNIICISVKHHQLSFDFRKNWMADMCHPNG